MPERYVSYPEAVVHEFIIRATKTPGGSRDIVVLTRTARGLAMVDRIVSDQASFSESQVAGIIASLTDAFMRELVITDGVRLAPADSPY